MVMTRSGGVTQRHGKSTAAAADSDSDIEEPVVHEKTHPTVNVVFISLLLDLLAFTMILPLLPSLLEHYRQNDGPDGLYALLNDKIRWFQAFVGAPDRFSSVLFGGFLGSLFSLLQFLAAPLVGALSDVYGRKPVLLVCLMGISASYALWAVSSSFAIFVVARVVGGASKGNVNLAMAIIADVTTPATRGRGMAMVGIAFSVGFIIGPVIGALFARWSHSQSGDWFVVPALTALALSLADLAFVALKFKESLPPKSRAKSLVGGVASHVRSFVSLDSLFLFRAVDKLLPAEVRELRLLGATYFIYLFLYSGLEFTLTFLTHHKFGYTSMQQGWMFFGIGLTMAVLQGGFVRRLPPHRTKPTAVLGLFLIIPSFVCVGLASSPILLYVGLLLFAVSTAMVVSCMMALVSRFGGQDQKGTVTGIFRSLGALARALGPIVASISYWGIGSTTTYLLGGAGLVVPWLMLLKSKP